MTGHASYIPGILVAALGLAILLFVALRRKQDRLKKQASLPDDRAVILEALKQGERIRAVFDAADETDLDVVKSFLHARGIPFIMDEESLGSAYNVYLPRDVVPLTIFVLRRDEEKARKLIAEYTANKGKRPG